MEYNEDDYGYYDDEDYEKMSPDQLLALAADDQLAAEAFYYQYHISDNPVLEAKARKVLKSLAEDYEATSFWLDWYLELRDSDDPKEQADAEAWRQKILDENCFDKMVLVHYDIIQPEELPYDELLELAREDTAIAMKFYNLFKHDDNPAIKAEVRSILKTLAEDGIWGFWPEWYRELRSSDNPDDQMEAEKWRQKILDEGAWDKEVLMAYGLLEDGEAEAMKKGLDEE